MLTLADEGGRGGWGNGDNGSQRREGRVWTPPFLAVIICEQPLTIPSPPEGVCPLSHAGDSLTDCPVFGERGTDIQHNRCKLGSGGRRRKFG